MPPLAWAHGARKNLVCLPAMSDLVQTAIRRRLRTAVPAVCRTAHPRGLRLRRSSPPGHGRPAGAFRAVERGCPLPQELLRRPRLPARTHGEIRERMAYARSSGEPFAKALVRREVPSPVLPEAASPACRLGRSPLGFVTLRRSGRHLRSSVNAGCPRTARRRPGDGPAAARSHPARKDEQDECRDVQPKTHRPGDQANGEGRAQSTRQSQRHHSWSAQQVGPRPAGPLPPGPGLPIRGLRPPPQPDDAGEHRQATHSGHTPVRELRLHHSPSVDAEIVLLPTAPDKARGCGGGRLSGFGRELPRDERLGPVG